jgi:NAD-dependent dihydropyrimidine dehydrogenase PreA subunit
MSELLYLKNVSTLRMSDENCVGCGMCLDVCPRAVFTRNNGKVTIVNRDACIECGACQRNCAFAALSVRAGVGCAHAIINAALGRTGSACCCTIEPKEPNGPAGSCAPSDRTSCG